MTKSEIIAECRANPDKIFHLLRENDFERARLIFGEDKYTWCGFNKNTHGDYEDNCWCSAHQESFINPKSWQYHLQQAILTPDVLGYLEEHGKEGE